MLTVWLPVTDATEENGCLCVVPRSHLGGLAPHCPGTTPERPGLFIPDAVRRSAFTPVPLRRGSALFLHRRAMHAPLPNRSSGVRWSFDLRYQPIGQPPGRPWFPSCIARSRQNPASAVTNLRVWAELWRAVRDGLAQESPAGPFNRWTGAEAVCASA